MNIAINTHPRGVDPRATLVYDVQVKLASGDILTRKGTFAVTGDVTRATS